MADEENQNGRIYRLSLWENVLRSPSFQERMKNRRLFGQLGHPADGIVSPSEISHVTTDVKLQKNERTQTGGVPIWGRSEVLPTPRGQILMTLHDNNVFPGISSRGWGESYNEGDKIVLEDEFECAGWDFVTDPSVASAYPQPENFGESVERLVDRVNSRRGVLESEVEQVLKADAWAEMNAYKKYLEEFPKHSTIDDIKYVIESAIRINPPRVVCEVKTDLEPTTEILSEGDKVRITGGEYAGRRGVVHGLTRSMASLGSQEYLVKIEAPGENVSGEFNAAVDAANLQKESKELATEAKFKKDDMVRWSKDGQVYKVFGTEGDQVEILGVTPDFQIVGKKVPASELKKESISQEQLQMEIVRPGWYLVSTINPAVKAGPFSSWQDAHDELKEFDAASRKDLVVAKKTPDQKWYRGLKGGDTGSEMWTDMGFGRLSPQDNIERDRWWNKRHELARMHPDLENKQDKATAESGAYRSGGGEDENDKDEIDEEGIMNATKDGTQQEQVYLTERLRALETENADLKQKLQTSEQQVTKVTEKVNAGARVIERLSGHTKKLENQLEAAKKLAKAAIDRYQKFEKESLQLKTKVAAAEKLVSASVGRVASENKTRMTSHVEDLVQRFPESMRAHARSLLSGSKNIREANNRYRQLRRLTEQVRQPDDAVLEALRRKDAVAEASNGNGRRRVQTAPSNPADARMATLMEGVVRKTSKIEKVK